MTDDQWLTADQLCAWKKLIAVVELLPGALESELRRDADLSHFDYFTLAMLSEAPRRTLQRVAEGSSRRQEPVASPPRRLGLQTIRAA